MKQTKTPKCKDCGTENPDKFGPTKKNICRACYAKANRFNPKVIPDKEWFGGVRRNIISL